MTYKNCDDAYSHGVSDIPKADPSYAAKLDRDSDGIGCERADAPAGFVPRTATPTVKPATATTAASSQPQLPVTGPATETAVAGGALLAVGVACVAIARRRRRRAN